MAQRRRLAHIFLLLVGLVVPVAVTVPAGKVALVVPVEVMADRAVIMYLVMTII